VGKKKKKTVDAFLLLRVPSHCEFNYAHRCKYTDKKYFYINRLYIRGGKNTRA